jgi:DNA-binding GntR family transcriptional regulator
MKLVAETKGEGEHEGQGGGDSLVAQIAEALAARIVSGALGPGARLRQDHVAAEFGASHVPVREAFRLLEARGLAVAAPRRGVTVAPLDPAAALEIAEMRAALEALALRHAAPRFGPADLDRAERAIAAGQASDDVADWEAANRRFHRALTAPAAMPRLLAAIDDLHRAAARFLFATWRGLDWRARSDLEHRAILAELRGGRTEAAARLLELHVREAGAALSARLAGRAPPA